MDRPVAIALFFASAIPLTAVVYQTLNTVRRAVPHLRGFRAASEHLLQVATLVNVRPAAAETDDDKVRLVL